MNNTRSWVILLKDVVSETSKEQHRHQPLNLRSVALAVQITEKREQEMSVKDEFSYRCALGCTNNSSKVRCILDYLKDFPYTGSLTFVVFWIE
ncbi:hypothetical protein TNCV_631901 [Trichonephila clavipes]|nr:hypothetical protein TNCV_631901 [Trichonephila clavipes]